VYSLGCVLYEMLAGQPPHTGPSAQNILVRILTEDPRDVTELRRTVPPHVAATVMKSIEKLPADRFGTAKEFLEALADEGFSYQAQPTAAAARTVSGATPPLAGGRSWVRDWRIVASLLLAMASSGLAGALWLEPEPELTTTRLSIDLEDIGLTAPHRVEVSQDGARFVMSGVDAGRSLYVRDADEQSFRLIPGTESGQFPAFSPSGDWIVYRENGTRSLQKVAVSGGAPRPVVAPGPYNPSMPDWSVDGSIVFISDVTELYQVSETGGEPKLLFDHSVPLANPRQLPGGDKIIMTDVENQLTVLLHVESGLIEELLPGGIDARYVETGHLVYADLSDGLWAVRFDAERGEITGEVTPIFSGLTTFRGQFARYSVSQTGTLVYSTGGGSGGALRPRQRLLIVGMDGQAEEVPIAPRIYRNVRWSPDGASIAFSGLGPGEDTGSSHIYVYNVDLRTAPRQLTFEGTQGWPVWSPDGQRLAFNSTQGLPAAERPGGQSLGATGGANLHVQAAFDDSEPMLVLDRDDTQFPYSWPDSSVLVFTDGSGGTSDLLMLDMADSGAVSEYLNIEADLGAMRISPDGRRIAYGSSESGSFEIYVRSFPQARQQVIISENGGDRPRWSPEGDALYYWKVGPGPDTLMMARLQDEPAFGVVSREVVLEADYVPSTWDIHPSGDRFIIAQDESQAVAEAAGGPVERFFVVVNWFEELKAALGEGN
jgi:serine/threonine-protein kinase